jgi:hypothetical protein
MYMFSILSRPSATNDDAARDVAPAKTDEHLYKFLHIFARMLSAYWRRDRSYLMDGYVVTEITW